MRRLIGIIVCLLVIGSIGGVEYQPIGFSSTSSMISSSQTEPAARPMMASAKPQTYGSVRAISAANFTALNSEGGALYNPAKGTSAIRKAVSRPTDSDENEDNLAIGEINFRSPVGATPWLLMILLAALYICYPRRSSAVDN